AGRPGPPALAGGFAPGGAAVLRRQLGLDDRPHRPALRRNADPPVQHLPDRRPGLDRLRSDRPGNRDAGAVGCPGHRPQPWRQRPARLRLRPYGLPPAAGAGRRQGLGIALSQQSLRGVLGFCNAPQMTSPEAYIQMAPGLIDDAGNVTVDSTREFLSRYMQEFRDFIARVLTVLPREG